LKRRTTLRKSYPFPLRYAPSVNDSMNQ
jgi:hypothetical protein